MLNKKTPFHAGELAAQQRAGANHVAAMAAPFIRDHMPDQHRIFFEEQPFLVAASNDADGDVWATVIEGPNGFVRSPDPRTLTLATSIDPGDPLADALKNGTDVGVIGIELATRRRNRLSGKTRRTDIGFAIDVRQSFGNCPQYITEREWWRATKTHVSEPRRSDKLGKVQIARIGAADTMFIGSGQKGQEGSASNGFDASHRGGAPGFVEVVSPTRLRIPDYSGNNFFNTIGNLLEDPRVGLLFVDFETGGLLHVTGCAEIDWSPDAQRDPDTLRVIDVTIEAVVDRPGALSLRWTSQATPSRQLVVTDKVVEAEGITSFHLTPANGDALASFHAGQHLPITLDIPGYRGKVGRSYSLSGRNTDLHYRITVKRDPKGVASRFLHDQVQIGDTLDAGAPAGDFAMPSGDGPLVLVSAGVGLTPLLAMLHETKRQVWFVHGARNGRQHALGAEVDRIVASNPNASRLFYYSAPENSDVIGRDFDVEGRITPDSLLALNAGDAAAYMLCGPASFVADLTTGLESAGVSKDRIRFETF